MNSRISYFIRLYYIFLRIHCFISDLKLLFSSDIVNGKSYFPELAKKRKCRIRIFADQCVHLLTRGSINRYYYLYGLDIRGFRNPADYINTDTFFVRRNFLRDMNGQNRYESVLRDKLLFYCYARAVNIPVPLVYGHIDNNLFISLYDSEPNDAYNYILSNKICGFAKAIDGECGKGVYAINGDPNGVSIDGVIVSEQVFKSIFADGRFILQERVNNQHPAISALHPHAINTIRLSTIKSGDGYEVWPPLLRVGTGVSQVDNWAAGGLAIGIDTEKQSLREFGFYKPNHGTKVAIHPDTGIRFKGYSIPFLQEAIDLAIEFHKLLPSLHSIGWDIAITTEGPVFIEGNDNWENSLVEACSHGLNKEFKRLFY